MKNLIGVMQGRLLPKYQGRYQAHPVGYWQDEFAIAKQINLDCIEFILDYNDAERNPLMSDDGVAGIQKIVARTGVAVKTVCADYFMEAPLHSVERGVAAQSLNVMRRLFVSARELGITDIVLPCVDQSSLNGTENAERLVTVLRPLLPEFEGENINISLETDLGPAPFASLIGAFGSKNVTVNYDIGNSAALGFNPAEELAAYGSRITDIHIKDRKRGGGSVALGAGDADFNLFFQALAQFDYQGPFIMQAYRDDEGVEIFKRQLAWVAPYISKIAP